MPSASISLQAYALREIPQLEKKSDLILESVSVFRRTENTVKRVSKRLGGKSAKSLDCEVLTLTLW